MLASPALSAGITEENSPDKGNSGIRFLQGWCLHGTPHCRRSCSLGLGRLWGRSTLYRVLCSPCSAMGHQKWRGEAGAFLKASLSLRMAIASCQAGLRLSRSPAACFSTWGRYSTTVAPAEPTLREGCNPNTSSTGSWDMAKSGHALILLSKADRWIPFIHCLSPWVFLHPHQLLKVIWCSCTQRAAFHFTEGYAFREIKDSSTVA